VFIADGEHPHRDRAIAELDPGTDGQVLEQRRVRHHDAMIVTRSVTAGELHELASREVDAAVGERTCPDLRAGQVGEDRDLAATFGGHRSDPFEDGEVPVEIAVAEVQAHHVGAGVDQPTDHLGGVARRSDGRHDLRSPGHICLSISQWNC
jgi:hypothetical protein